MSDISTQKKSGFINKAIKKFNQSSFEIIFFSLTFLVLSVMAVTAFSYYKNSRAILSLTEDLIDQINNRVIQKTTSYLFTAVDMTELSSKVAGEGSKTLLDNPGLNSLMINILILHPQLTMFNIGNERGDFLQQKRMNDGTIATKTIDRSKKEPIVKWKYRNDIGQIIKEEITQEKYDPRERPWYIGAKEKYTSDEKKKLFWSDVYIFNTGKIPGITASAPVLADGKLMGIFGLDIPLIEISNFLEDLRKEIQDKKFGKTAIAFIVNSKGDLVAYPDVTQPMIKEGEDKFRSRKVVELEVNPPIVQESYKHFAETKETKFTIEIEGKRYIASYKQFPDTFEKDWTIGLVVPEDDYIGAIKETNKLNLTISIVILGIAMGLALILNRIKKALNARNEFIKNTFGRYLSDDVVTSILESPKGTSLGGEKREVTIMMTDLRGFTSISERLSAEKCVNMINNYLDVMTDVILKYNGTIDEFIGDAILVIFGAPILRDDDAARAVACAIEMQLAMKLVNEKNKQDGLPEVVMGIGLNTGEIVVGNIGSHKRTKYGVVGSNVNLTSRIESYTVGGQTLVSQRTLDACGGIVRVDDQFEVMPKGVKNPIIISEVGGIGGEYNIYLPEKKEIVLHPIKKKIQFLFTILAGKHASTDVHIGYITKMNGKEAEIEAPISVEKLNNVKVVLADENGKELANDLYAKVTKNISESPKVIFRVNFTSVPTEVENVFKEIQK
ncbi:MAG: Cache 3/Cache 2 fusion domain-containing protein [Leptospiraceae bacterium]|nr:Cache 3/Cache 2 fusion domain-containing protein [Leptospiraceae bacterium]